MSLKETIENNVSLIKNQEDKITKLSNAKGINEKKLEENSYLL